MKLNFRLLVMVVTSLAAISLLYASWNNPRAWYLWILITADIYLFARAQHAGRPMMKEMLDRNSIFQVRATSTNFQGTHALVDFGDSDVVAVFFRSQYKFVTGHYYIWNGQIAISHKEMNREA